MNNADQPAMPVTVFERDPGGDWAQILKGGLTKREEIASRLLAALFANPAITAELNDALEPERSCFLIDAAVDNAARLLDQIEKEAAEGFQ